MPSNPSRAPATGLVGGPGVDDDRQTELRGERELALEEAELRVRRRMVTVEVEPRLAHGDRLLVPEQRLELLDPARLLSPGLVRVDPERGEHAGFFLRDGEGGPAGADPGADRDHALDAGCARPFEERPGRNLARVEVRVRVDHGTMRASSSSTTFGSSFLKSGFGSPSCCPAGSSLGAHRPSQVS